VIRAPKTSKESNQMLLNTNLNQIKRHKII